MKFLLPQSVAKENSYPFGSAGRTAVQVINREYIAKTKSNNSISVTYQSKSVWKLPKLL